MVSSAECSCRQGCRVGQPEHLGGGGGDPESPFGSLSDQALELKCHLWDSDHVSGSSSSSFPYLTPSPD